MPPPPAHDSAAYQPAKQLQLPSQFPEHTNFCQQCKFEVEMQRDTLAKLWEGGSFCRAPVHGLIVLQAPVYKQHS